MSPSTEQGLSRREGHLLDLSLERYFYEELSGAPRASVETHLSDCGECRGRLERLRSESAEISLLPPKALLEPRTNNVVSLDARRPRRIAMWAGPAVGALLAASLAVVVWNDRAGERAASASDENTSVGAEFGESVPGDTWRRKGSDFSLDFYLHDGQDTYALMNGDVVHEGDRVGFLAHALSPGYLVIVGLDALGRTYPCYPQGNEEQAERVEPSEEPLSLDQAIRFDGVLGQERLVAVFCPEAFEVSAVARALEVASDQPEDGELPPLKAGCWQRSIVLEKRELSEE
jgi:hypothetical protein